ncbi:hypothetical protein [Methylobacter tundripaludum]|uniref:Uncharacterized protein n=1 Tax=Methylobacter tundripaludum (strain ATCC BAA-1195 / DSM 17260 / SV96) TaxID=697282 RepID=G3ITW4_METTV|nr:hypothetical protein [Methylobacter tundripaludum]EGW21447.1 hypothetical protein Mettu_0206 [Methylobacter tundripaludum SV96]
MNNMLKDALEVKDELLVRYGIKVSFRAPCYGSCGADLESSQYVGGITYWPEKSLFEFQFNSCKSGDVIILDTKEFHAKEELAAFIEDLITTQLSR